MDEKPVISISRTKDVVRCAPRLLARFLNGKAPVRFARSPELHTLDLRRVGAVALWTKDPANLWSCVPLRDLLREFQTGNGGAVLLNLTVTGCGGSVLEPGIPDASTVAASLRRLLEANTIEPEAVILRYDPLIEVRTPRGRVGNIDNGLFASITAIFASLGVRRIKVSPADYHYAHISKRLAACGFEPVERGETALNSILDEMKDIALDRGMRFDVCCHPRGRVDDGTAGCIDGTLINALLAARGASFRVTEELHNRIGQQRKSCRCTYSRDIGYSPGVPGCFTSSGACLYCYSQRTINSGLVPVKGENGGAARRSA